MEMLDKGVGLIDMFLYAFSERYEVPVWTLDRKLMAVLPKPFRPRHRSAPKPKAP